MIIDLHGNLMDYEINKDYPKIGEGSFSEVYKINSNTIMKTRVELEEHYKYTTEVAVLKYIAKTKVKEFYPNLEGYSLTYDKIFLDYFDGETLMTLANNGELTWEIIYNIFDILKQTILSGIKLMDLNENNILINKFGDIRFIDLELYSIDCDENVNQLIPDFVHAISKELNALMNWSDGESLLSAFTDFVSSDLELKNYKFI